MSRYDPPRTRSTCFSSSEVVLQFQFTEADLKTPLPRKLKADILEPGENPGAGQARGSMGRFGESKPAGARHEVGAASI
jgi:hypothetical protein